MDYEVLANGKIQLGSIAPEFVCNSTCGEIKFPDKQDNWTVIFSYKEDFYSIATSEVIALQQNKYLFDELNTRVVCISTGNLLSHIAWLESIYRLYNIKVTFPVLEDPIGQIARKYGIVSKELGDNCVTSSVIIIDNKGVIKVILQYLPSIERNIFEILRVISKLK